ncbi:MAG: dihydrodipicolinate synthase family protein [Veillonella sp.]|uniref:dihydrodipicolinate synthase family protein n=1 Tax=Veillonella sp. TaxID=1926307 RepID=UPI0025F485DF|nr:dihydrodipicolinate synthase family protein [Veillonella sp.]MBS4914035.1 dihydrodipicolinate synthase family protein [Veillonella sp.]
MENLDKIRGIMVPIITPVDKNEEIDLPKLDEIIDRCINGGVSGILLFGSNGEFYMFSEEEMESTLKHVLEYVNGRVPVLFGIGAIRTKTCVRLAKMAERHKAFGISILQPMFLKLTEQELTLHFDTIAKAVSKDFPVLLYNNPGRTGYFISPNVVETVARNNENIVGMKDSSGDISLLQEFLRRTKFKPFKIFGGKDTLVYASLCVGADGGVCSIAQVMPEETVRIFKEFEAGNMQAAREAQEFINPIRLSQDKASFPVATKVMCNMIGLEVGDSVRPSLPSPEAVVSIFDKELTDAGILPKK